MELEYKVQNYDWGKRGVKSLVARLAGADDERFNVQEQTPYAELWMGTHVNGPSTLKYTGESLDSFISVHPEYLGSKVAEVFGNKLPFLFKVLSVEKALSIQAHPTKSHAEKLHKEFPNIYKDPNHKPELAIALTPFEVLCGFRPVKDVRNFLDQIPELSCIVKKQQKMDKDDTIFLKDAFRAVLTCDKNRLIKIIDSILMRIRSQGSIQKRRLLGSLVEQLHGQFPYDNGILMVYFLNYIKLDPYEAVYLAANEPHAYLSGDCIETMACSDNVVRAGLTPKFVDVETLCGMLTYESERPENKILQPMQEQTHTRVFEPPVQDFAVAEIKLSKDIPSYTVTKRESASIFIVIAGKAKFRGRTLSAGKCFFLPAHESMVISEIEGDDFHMYQAFANVK